MAFAFLATVGDYSDYMVLAAFNTRTQAETFVAEYNKGERSRFAEVQEVPLNPEPPTYWDVWVCEINCATGQINEPYTDKVDSWRKQGSNTDNPYYCKRGGQPIAIVRSDADRYDAIALVLEAHTAYLVRNYSRYWVEIDLDTGELVQLRTEILNDTWGREIERTRKTQLNKIQCSSDKSQEHANKLAIEARQQWLRQIRHREN